MRKRRTGEPAPPPAKRGQRRKYEQEVDEKTGELLSMETRARRGRELNHLREENEALKKERTEFLAKIEGLSTQLDSFTRNAPAEVVAEHAVLTREIALHSELRARRRIRSIFPARSCVRIGHLDQSNASSRSRDSVN